MSEMRECPLCRSKKVYLHDCGCMAACDSCGLQLYRSDPEDTIKDWNTRPTPAANDTQGVLKAVTEYDLSKIPALVEACESILAASPKERPDRDDYDMSKGRETYGVDIEAYLTASILSPALAAVTATTTGNTEKGME